MLIRLLLLVFAAATWFAASPALSAPRVVADILPIQSLVARVMEGVGTPASVVPPGASPHAYAMRPSEARTLAEAEVVFWVGEALAPWFRKAIDGLAEDAVVVELMEAPGVVVFDFPERGHDDEHGEHGDEHEDHDEHGDEHEDHDEHGDEHDEHDEHGDEHEEHGEHGDEHDESGEHDEHGDEHAHEHEGADPHIWLDPRNGQAILAAVAERLAQIDPDNAAEYAANAEAGAAELDALMTRTEALLAPVRGKAFATAHDAYQYFERRFGIRSAGAVASVDSVAPGPEQLAEVREIIREENVICVFIEPQIDDKLVRVAAEGSDARVGVLDPTGERLEPGPGLYPALIEGLAQDLADCLAGP